MLQPSVLRGSQIAIAAGFALVFGVGCSPAVEGPAGGAGGAGGFAPLSTPMPCAVADAVRINCQGCHGAQPIGGAPMSLMRYEDFHQDYVIKTTELRMGQIVKLFTLAHERLNGSVIGKPMPPAPIDAVQKQTLNDWFASGALPGTEADRACNPMTAGVGGGVAGVGGGVAGVGGVGGGVAGVGGGVAGVGGGVAGAGGSGGMVPYSMEPLIPRPEIGEKCYDLKSHGGQTISDTSPFMVPTGERYSQFYFTIPWGPDEVASRFGARFDNTPVLHHWLLFTAVNKQAGTSQTFNGPVDVLAGQQGGQELLSGWAIGGSSMTFPDDVGGRLPTPGGGITLNVQWHTWNETGSPQPDSSAVQVCTVPRNTRANLASMTWLGTEDLGGQTVTFGGMGPGMHSFSGTCENDSGADITITTFWPHMHRIGIHMASSIVMGPEVFSQPFFPDRQIHYDARLVLKPGQKIISTCTYNNTTGRKVGFGESTNDEMCYQFVYSYPAGALDNGVNSLIMAKNTCWGD